jgi:hypothetical protein
VKILEKSIKGKYFVVTCKLTMNTQQIPTNLLIDSGATEVACIDPDCSCHQMIPLQKFNEKWDVQVIDGRPLVSREITHIITVGW